MPVADVLLVDRVQRRLLQRERVLDKSGKVGHVYLDNAVASITEPNFSDTE